MRKIQIFKLIALLLLSSSLTAQTETDNTRPNVILIMADDMGYGDLGIHGNPIVKTPELDKLAKESIEFSNFYVSPVCAPTRASLLTGRYSIRTGVYDTYSGGAIMATEETTIAEIFKSAHYETAIFGKWHLGDSYPFRPQDQGFDHSVWHLSGGIGQVGDVFNYYKHDRSYFDPVLYKNGEVYQSKGYCSDVYTDEAIDFIDSKGDKPFFLYLSFNAPHTPLQVPDTYYKKYKDEKIDPEVFRQKGLYTHDMTEKNVEDAKRVYAMVSNIDDNVGRLIETLKKNKKYQNTIIIFMTDNGPQQYRYVGGYRGLKGQVREGGVHVPFYLKTPKKLGSVKAIETPSAHIDILPTLASLCNIKLPKNLYIDGLSHANEIYGDSKIDQRPLFFEWQRSYPEKYRNMAVIYKDFKLVANTSEESDSKKFELYNLKNDPYEAKNISVSNISKVEEMKSKLDLWYEDIMESEHIKNIQRIIIGSPNETHTILNRNDAKGLPLIWDQEDIYVRWDLNVIHDGPYQIKCHFREPLEESGDLVLRLGQQHMTKKISSKNTQTVVYDNVRLKNGEVSIEAWYYVRWKEHKTPFYIEIINKSF